MRNTLHLISFLFTLLLFPALTTRSFAQNLNHTKAVSLWSAVENCNFELSQSLLEQNTDVNTLGWLQNKPHAIKTWFTPWDSINTSIETGKNLKNKNIKNRYTECHKVKSLLVQYQPQTASQLLSNAIQATPDLLKKNYIPIKIFKSEYRLKFNHH